MSTFGKLLSARSISRDTFFSSLADRLDVPFVLLGLRAWMQGLLPTNFFTAASSPCLAFCSDVCGIEVVNAVVVEVVDVVDVVVATKVVIEVVVVVVDGEDVRLHGEVRAAQVRDPLVHARISRQDTRLGRGPIRWAAVGGREHHGVVALDFERVGRALVKLDALRVGGG